MAAENVISSLVKKIENFVSSRPGLGEKYGEIFYGEMVDREIELADISSGDRIAHLGCGPFPFTAFELAGRGWEVDAVDFDEEALKRAEELAERYGLESRINFTHGLCQEIDYSRFDAVWVSYNVRPGRECLCRIAETIGSRGKIIYRQPKSWLNYFDGRINAEELFSGSELGAAGDNGELDAELKWRSASVEQNVGKKSVMIEIGPVSGGENLEERFLSLQDFPVPSS